VRKGGYGMVRKETISGSDFWAKIEEAMTKNQQPI